eukprot:g14835.t1
MGFGPSVQARGQEASGTQGLGAQRERRAAIRSDAGLGVATARPPAPLATLRCAEMLFNACDFPSALRVWCCAPMGLLVLHVLSLVAVEGSSRAIIRHGERLSLDQSPEAAGTATEAPVAREVDAFGRCTIPMWNARDRKNQRPDSGDRHGFRMRRAFAGRLRKKMDDGQSCTVAG